MAGGQQTYRSLSPRWRALLLLALFLQGCEDGGSGAGGGDAGQSMEVAPGGAEIDAVQETQTGAQIVERP